MTRPTCPACRFNSVTAHPLALDAAFCAGVGVALAAQHMNAVRFPFDFCPAHATAVRAVMNDSVEKGYDR